MYLRVDLAIIWPDDVSDFNDTFEIGPLHSFHFRRKSPAKEKAKKNFGLMEKKV